MSIQILSQTNQLDQVTKDHLLLLAPLHCNESNPNIYNVDFLTQFMNEDLAKCILDIQSVDIFKHEEYIFVKYVHRNLDQLEVQIASARGLVDLDWKNPIIDISESELSFITVYPSEDAELLPVALAALVVESTKFLMNNKRIAI